MKEFQKKKRGVSDFLYPVKIFRKQTDFVLFDFSDQRLVFLRHL